MSDDGAASQADAAEVLLEGTGPFQLPLCTDLASIALGEALAFLQFETAEGQRVDLPVPIGLLVELGEAVAEALRVATETRDGTMMQ